MQLMTFSESGNSKYDLILMDLREKLGNYQTQMIWRRYCPLPQIPLLARSSNDTTAGIEAMKKRFSELPPQAQESLERFLEDLPKQRIDKRINTLGYALYDAHTKKSMYLSIEIDHNTWFIKRHQIRSDDVLFARMESDAPLARVTGATRDALERVTETYKVFCKVFEKEANIIGFEREMYEIWVYPSDNTDSQALITLLKSHLRYQKLSLSPQPVLEFAT